MTERAQKSGSLTVRAFWLMFAKAVAFVLGFALPLLLVRRLNQFEFGLYKQVFLVVSTSITVLPLGFSLSAYYFLPREAGDKRAAVVLNIFCFNAAIGLTVFLLLVAKPSILASLFGAQTAVSYAPLIGLVILLWISAMFIEIAAISNQEAKLATAFIVFAQFSKTTFLLAAALGFGTIRSLLYAAIAHGIVQNVMLLFYLHARFPKFWSRLDWHMMGRQLSYALPIGFAGLVFGILMDMHNYIVSYRFGPAAFAVYAVGCFSLPLVNIVGESFGAILIPHISALQKQNAAREIVLVTAQTMRKLSLVYFPLYACLLVLGREFLTILFTKQYLASWPIFVVHLTTLPFFILITDPIMRAYAEHRFFLLKVRSVTVILLFFALWFGTLRFGLVGAICIMVIFSLADRFVETAKAWSIIGVKWTDAVLLKDIGKVAIAAAVAGIAAMFTRSALLSASVGAFGVLAVSGAIFGAVYLLAIALLGVVTPGEWTAIRQRVGVMQSRRPGRPLPHLTEVS